MWIAIVTLINWILLVDLILQIVFYGWRPIVALKKEFVYEGILQLIYLSFFITYCAASVRDNLTRQI